MLSFIILTHYSSQPALIGHFISYTVDIGKQWNDRAPAVA